MTSSATCGVSPQPHGVAAAGGPDGGRDSALGVTGGGPRSPRRARALLELGGVAALLGLLLLISLQQRLPQMQRPFWEDEVHHNFGILRSRNLRDLRWSIQAQQQPMLDYVIRKVGWFNVLGYQELHLRAPALLASLATVAAIFLATYCRFRRQGLLVAAALALALGAWAATNPDEIYYAAEARHYSLVSLVSVLWAAAFLVSERLPRGAFVAGSAVFVNTHFFSIPLVCAGLALNAMSLGKGRKLTGLVKSAGIGALLLAATIWINYPSFRWLATTPPGNVASASWGRLVEALRGGAVLWSQFGSYLGLPVPLLVVGAVLLAFAAAGIERGKVLRLLALAFVVLPGLFVYFRFRSDYFFGARYFTPFFGLGFAMLLTAAECTLAAISLAAAAKGRKRLATLGPVAVGVAALAACGVPGALAGVAKRSALKVPAANFSPYFQLYGELRASGRPLFVLHSHCWANDIPLLYLQHVGGEAYRGGYQVADSKGCETKVADTREALRSFLEINPRGIVVLDDKERDCSTSASLEVAGAVTVERVRLPVCVWKISGAATIDEVAAVAEAVGFPAAAGLF